MGSAKPNQRPKVKGTAKAQTDVIAARIESNLGELAGDIAKAVEGAAGTTLDYVLLVRLPDGSIFQASTTAADVALQMMADNLRHARDNPNAPVRSLSMDKLDS